MASLPRTQDDSRSTDRRLVALMAAGLVDSLLLSFAWTVVILEVTRAHGLIAAGIASTAMLVGIALSAPTAGWMAARLDGRRLLRTAAGVEAVLRGLVFLLLFTGAPVWSLAVCVAAMNVVAWTGYAGMRAEVSAVSAGAGGLTWYGTVVAAVEAVGVALAALLPLGTEGGASGPLLGLVALLYVLALLPTVVVAGGSRVRRMAREPRGRATGMPRRLPRVSGDAVGGAVLMFTASAPTLLAVALAAQLHGRSAVGLAAIAFTAGSLAAPALAGRVQRRGANHATTWALCAVGMVVGWVLAPYSVALMCLAQLASGLFMTTLEGLLDTKAAERSPGGVTAALARATAGRALGSAGGTALLPLAVVGVGLQQSAVTLVAVLAGAALVLHAVRRAAGIRDTVRLDPLPDGAEPVAAP